MKFEDFKLCKPLLKAIDEAGFVTPSPVQKEAIPLILSGKDVIAQAQTGTGKTAAFGLPIMHHMGKQDGVEALVIVPTRELALQVSDELYRFGKYAGYKTATVYGGTPYQKQIQRIQNAQIVIATAGRLLDLLKSGKITLSPRFVVLDEADEMLDMGFLDEIKAIFSFLPKKRQTLMFSATMPPAIRTLAESILHDPVRVSITQKERTNSKINQRYFVVPEHEKVDALIRLMDYFDPQKCIVFCRTKKDVDTLSSHLRAQGFKAGGLHGDMEQKQREVTIRDFKKSHGIDLLVATDVAARGLDVHDVTHVFNYAIPYDSESYVHRIGRTGRGGKSGEAITLVTPTELRTIQKIEKDVGATIVTDVIPTKEAVLQNKSHTLLKTIAHTPVSSEAIDLVRTLQHDYDIVTLAHKLSTLLLSHHQIEGKDKIGLSIQEVKTALKASMQTTPKRKRSQTKYRPRRHRNRKVS